MQEKLSGLGSDLPVERVWQGLPPINFGADFADCGLERCLVAQVVEIDHLELGLGNGSRNRGDKLSAAPAVRDRTSWPSPSRSQWRPGAS